MLLTGVLAAGCVEDEPTAPASEKEQAMILEAEESWFLERGSFAPNDDAVAFRVIAHGTSQVGVWRDGRSRLITEPRLGAHEFAWMPDGKHLLVAADAAPTFDRLIIITLGGDIVREIELRQRVRIETGMSVSPDGRSAIASAQPAGTLEEAADLVLVDLGTGHIAQVTRTPRRSEDYPSFIGEGTVVATAGPLVSHAPGSSSRVFLIDIGSGSRLGALTPPHHSVSSATVFAGGASFMTGTTKTPNDPRSGTSKSEKEILHASTRFLVVFRQ